MDDAPKNFMTLEQCAEQFEMYAESNPSVDSQHSLRFCAKFLREFCIQPNGSGGVSPPVAENSRMHEARLALRAIIDEFASDKGLQRLGSKQTLLELQQLTSKATRVLAKARRQRENWATKGIYR